MDKGLCQDSDVIAPYNRLELAIECWLLTEGVKYPVRYDEREQQFAGGHGCLSEANTRPAGGGLMG